MNLLKPQPPFVWPEPRIWEKSCDYEYYPPFFELAQASSSLFGTVNAITSSGIELLETWLKGNPNLRANIIVIVYPACSTQQKDLMQLLDLVEIFKERLVVHIRPLATVTDRGTNALFFLKDGTNDVHVVTGPTEDFGLASVQEGQFNFVFRAEATLVEAFKRHFDWLWAYTREITAERAASIPDLIIPGGTTEATESWEAYMAECLYSSANEDPMAPTVNVDPSTGDVTYNGPDGEAISAPTETLGLPKLDSLADYIARIYEKGFLVSIDKMSRIPPLDVPLDPSLLGDPSAMQKGSVTRKVSMRVSIIDEKYLKEIEKRRQGLRVLLSRFTFGLADNMRWMPSSARKLFESTLEIANKKGRELITALLQGGVDKFIESKKSKLKDDINAMYKELGRSGGVSSDIIEKVVASLKERLEKAESANFMPTLSYSLLSFSLNQNDLVSPWGQAYSLLSDIATFPRKAVTDKFFFSGLAVPENDLIEAMNIAEDNLCLDLGARNLKERCTSELDLLVEIERKELSARDRCELVKRILCGEPVQDIRNALDKKIDTSR